MIRRSGLRVAAASALGSALLSTLGAVAAEQSRMPAQTPSTMQPGEQTSVRATVPTVAKTKVRGKQVTRRVTRPTRLQKLTTQGWTTAASRPTTKTGLVSFAFPAPTATSRYRVLAPRHRVTVKRRTGGRVVAKRVVLGAWTGPTRTITVTSHPSPTQTSSPTPTQTPTQGPSESPTQAPSARLSLLTPRATGDYPHLTELSIDESGSVVAFTSLASDLVPDDDNNQVDVFTADTRTGEIELVSRAMDGSPANNASIYADVSPDGRYVAFTSQASDIVPGVHRGYQQVYLHDRVTRQTVLVSAVNGVPGDAHSRRPSVSRDGKHVAFETDAINLTTGGLPELPQLYHVLRYTHSSRRFDMATFPEGGVWAGNSTHVSMSDDGTRVAFASNSDHLVLDDDNGKADVFLYDFRTGLRKMISRGTDGSGLRAPSSAPVISGSGNAVLWQTRARTVVLGDDNDGDDAFRYDVARRTNTLVSKGPDGHSLDGHSSPLAMDTDGSHALLSSSAAGSGLSLYLCDVAAGTVRPLGSTADGAPYTVRDAAVRADGSRVAFSSEGSLTPDDLAYGTDVYFWEMR
jgi:TolB protein